MFDSDCVAKDNLPVRKTSDYAYSRGPPIRRSEYGSILTNAGQNRLARPAIILITRFLSGKCLGEWRKDTLLSLSDAMIISCPEK